MITKRTHLTEYQIQQILDLFYRTELRTGEKIIDNRSITISKELGISTQVIDGILARHLNDKFNIINQRIALNEV